MPTFILTGPNLTKLFNYLVLISNAEFRNQFNQQAMNYSNSLFIAKYKTIDIEILNETAHKSSLGTIIINMIIVNSDNMIIEEIHQYPITLS